jgi:hypothetical protein
MENYRHRNTAVLLRGYPFSFGHSRFPFAYHVQAQSREQPAILPASMYEGREILQVDRDIF